MNTLTLGFVGGCLTHQTGIPHPRLFHRVAGRWLEDERAVRLRLVVSKEFSAEPPLRVADLLREERPDVMLLHRSVHMFMTKAMAVFVATHGRYVVNPFLFRRRRNRSWLSHEHARFRDSPALWPPGQWLAAAPRPATAPDDEIDTPEIPQATLARAHAAVAQQGVRLRDLAWTVGRWAGLEAWAVAEELRIVEEARAECLAASVPLLVLGPGLRIGVARAMQVAARVDAALTGWARAAGDVGYISLLTESPAPGASRPVDVEHYRDYGHLNVAGHEVVARRLLPHLDRLVGQNTSRPGPADG